MQAKVFNLIRHFDEILQNFIELIFNLVSKIKITFSLVIIPLIVALKCVTQ
jgi:hypothetical protein